MKSKQTALRHQVGKTCALCDAKLLTAHNDLAKWFRAAKEKWQNIHISWAYRDQAAQERAFAEGASLLHWPNSAHNHRVNDIPTSLALDIFQIDEDGIARFQYQFNKTLWAWTNQDYGANSFLWGGGFKSLGDSGHFELRPDTNAREMH